jgi:hypothetical protein
MIQHKETSWEMNIYQSVLKFAAGVLVIRLSDNEEIFLLKVCNQMLYPQQIRDPNFSVSSVSISSDGCAVLLYCKSTSDYQLWEIASENSWELRSTARLKFPEDHVAWFCLTGTENSRSSIWVTCIVCILGRTEWTSLDFFH